MEKAVFEKRNFFDHTPVFILSVANQVFKYHVFIFSFLDIMDAEMIFGERNDLKISKPATASGFPLVRSMIVQLMLIR